MAQQLKVRAVPVGVDPAVSGILSDLKIVAEHLLSQSPPPQPVTGLTATPIAGGAVVQFTRSNATDFRVYCGNTRDSSKAEIVDIGNNNKYTDTVGDGGVTRYYWVQAYASTNQAPSAKVGPVSATTLPLGTAATVTPVQDPSYGTVYDTTIGTTRPVVFGTDFIPPGKGR